MRQFRTSGSVRGAAREGGPYRDKRQVVLSTLNLELLTEAQVHCPRPERLGHASENLVA